jgi:hypothetical protein
MASRSAQDHYSDKSEQLQDDRDPADVPLAEATTVVTDHDDLLTDLDMSPREESDAEIMAALDPSDLDMTPAHEAVSVAEIMAALDAADDVASPDPVAPVADWLTDLRELAQKHGPFSAAQILQIVRELDAPGNEASR